MSCSFTTKTAYLCVYIRMNGKVVLLACLSFLPALHSRCNQRRFSSRNIFGWQPLMSATFLRTFAFLEIRVSSNCIFISLSFVSRNDLLAAHAHVINVCQEYRLPLFDDFLYSLYASIHSRKDKA